MFLGPTAAGTQRDLRAGTDLAAEYPYFASAEESARFISLTLNDAARRLPGDPLRYVDFGGGQGHLALAIKAHLEESGRRVDAVVADGNPAYLAGALRAGLEVLPCNLEACRLAGVHLISMRLVNHYNPRPVQLEILRRAFEGLDEKGRLLVQIETGSTENCSLRSDIADLLAQHRGEAPGYYWAPADDFERLLIDAGFTIDRRLDEAWQFQTPVSKLLEISWARFANGSAAGPAQACKSKAFAAALEILERRLARCGARRLGVEANGHDYLMHSAHSVFVATRQ